MTLVAVSGGIASGKSEVMRALRSLGAFTVSADEINAEMLSDPEYAAKLKERFPGVVADGKIDKKALRDLVFSDENARKRLNAVAHPEIFARMRKLCAGHAAAFCEVPLLREAGLEKYFDKIIFVTAPDDIRRDRLSVRDGITHEYADTIMAAQSAERELEKVADYVIINDGDISKLKAMTEEVYRKICGTE